MRVAYTIMALGIFTGTCLWLGGYGFGEKAGIEKGIEQGRRSIVCPAVRQTFFMYDNGKDSWTVSCAHECACRWTKEVR